MRHDSNASGGTDSGAWTAFYSELGEAIATVLDPEEGDPMCFIVTDPDQGRHGVTTDRDGCLVVTKPNGWQPDRPTRSAASLRKLSRPTKMCGKRAA